MNIMTDNNAAMRKDILAKLYMKNPQAFMRVIAATQTPLVGEVATTTAQALNEAANSETWFDKVLKGLQIYSVFTTQKDIAEINLERVRQGKEPLSTDITAQTLNLGLADQTRKTLLYVAAGLGLLLAIVLLRKKR
jgi:hypothetical protein